MLLKKKKEEKKVSGKLYSCINIREITKTNNIPSSSSSFSVLTGLAQQVLAPVGAQLWTSLWNPDLFLIKPVLRNLMEMAVKRSLTLSTLGLTPI